MKIKKYLGLAVCSVAVLASGIFFASGIYAYLTDQADPMGNNFTIALQPSHVIVEKFPSDGQVTPTPEGNTVNYEKAVQVANTGYLDEYVRVSVDFTDSSIRDKSKFSWDGTNFYSADPDAADFYGNHLPEGWVYDRDDGFFYYTPIVYADDFKEFEGQYLELDGEQYRYFYKEGIDIQTNPIITVPLIRYVRTTFANPKDMESYGINIISQSCPFYGGSDYKEAWANYNPNDF